MTRKTATRLWCVAFGLGLSPLASCSCGLTCGTGTADNGQGQCLPVGAEGEGEGEGEQLTCGAGTVDNGQSQCVPENPLACGAGTNDNGNGQCVVTNPITCGEGTEEQTGVCLPVGTFTPAPASTSLELPFDAAPSPDGSVIYYTAGGSDGETHSLWSVPFDGSAAPRELTTGLVAPLGIAVSSDGGTVFVGDTGDEDGADPDQIGGLLSVDASTGTATRVAGADGFEIKGLDLIDNNGTDEITFSGTDPADGEKGIFALVGGSVTLIAKGAPFSDPSGVAVTSTGDRYVVDTSAAEDGQGAVIKVDSADAASVFVEGINAGYPAGAALSHDEATLFVSGIGADGNALVNVIDLATGNVSFVNTGLLGNDEAGGLHRAKDSDSFAWAGTTTVYGITFQ